MESRLAATNSARQAKVRTEKNRKGMFISLGKISQWEPRKGNCVGDDTPVEEGDQTPGEEQAGGRHHGLEAGPCPAAAEPPW